MVFDRVADESTGVVSAVAAELGDVGYLAMVLVEVDEIEEPSMGNYVVDFFVEKRV